MWTRGCVSNIIRSSAELRRGRNEERARTPAWQRAGAIAVLIEHGSKGRSVESLPAVVVAASMFHTMYRPPSRQALAPGGFGGIPDAEHGFTLIFSTTPFPGYRGWRPERGGIRAQGEGEQMPRMNLGHTRIEN
jgi:hypothetical protein